jgi:ribosomal protein S14
MLVYRTKEAAEYDAREKENVSLARIQASVKARRSVFCILGTTGIGFIDQLGHLYPARSRCVMHEMQLRQSMDVQAVTELAAYVTRSCTQARYRILDLILVIAQHREEHFGVRIIRRDLHFGNRDHPDARVFQLERDDFRQIALDLICDAQTASWDGFTMFGHKLFYR